MKMKNIVLLVLGLLMFVNGFTQPPPTKIRGAVVNISDFNNGPTQLFIMNATKSDTGAIARNAGGGEIVYEYLQLYDVGNGCFTMDGSLDTLCLSGLSNIYGGDGTLSSPRTIYADGKTFTIDSASVISFTNGNYEDGLTLWTINDTSTFYGFYHIDTTNQIVYEDAIYEVDGSLVSNTQIQQGDYVAGHVAQIRPLTGVSRWSAYANTDMDQVNIFLDHANGWRVNHSGMFDTASIQFNQYGLKINDEYRFPNIKGNIGEVLVMGEGDTLYWGAGGGSGSGIDSVAQDSLYYYLYAGDTSFVLDRDVYYLKHLIPELCESDTFLSPFTGYNFGLLAQGFACDDECDLSSITTMADLENNGNTWTKPIADCGAPGGNSGFATQLSFSAPECGNCTYTKFEIEFHNNVINQTRDIIDGSCDPQETTTLPAVAMVGDTYFILAKEQEFAPGVYELSNGNNVVTFDGSVYASLGGFNCFDFNLQQPVTKSVQDIIDDNGGEILLNFWTHDSTEISIDYVDVKFYRECSDGSCDFQSDYDAGTLVYDSTFLYDIWQGNLYDAAQFGTTEQIRELDNDYFIFDKDNIGIPTIATYSRNNAQDLSSRNGTDYAFFPFTSNPTALDSFTVDIQAAATVAFKMTFSTDFGSSGFSNNRLVVEIQPTVAQTVSEMAVVFDSWASNWGYQYDAQVSVDTLILESFNTTYPGDGPISVLSTTIPFAWESYLGWVENDLMCISLVDTNGSGGNWYENVWYYGINNVVPTTDAELSQNFVDWLYGEFNYNGTAPTGVIDTAYYDSGNDWVVLEFLNGAGGNDCGGPYQGSYIYDIVQDIGNSIWAADVKFVVGDLCGCGVESIFMNANNVTTDNSDGFYGALVFRDLEGFADDNNGVFFVPAVIPDGQSGSIVYEPPLTIRDVSGSQVGTKNINEGDTLSMTILFTNINNGGYIGFDQLSMTLVSSCGDKLEFLTINQDGLIELKELVIPTPEVPPTLYTSSGQLSDNTEIDANFNDLEITNVQYRREQVNGNFEVDVNGSYNLGASNIYISDNGGGTDIYGTSVSVNAIQDVQVNSDQNINLSSQGAYNVNADQGVNISASANESDMSFNAEASIFLRPNTNSTFGGISINDGDATNDASGYVLAKTNNFDDFAEWTALPTIDNFVTADLTGTEKRLHDIPDELHIKSDTFKFTQDGSTNIGLQYIAGRGLYMDVNESDIWAGGNTGSLVMNSYGSGGNNIQNNQHTFIAFSDASGSVNSNYQFIDNAWSLIIPKDHNQYDLNYIRQNSGSILLGELDSVAKVENSFVNVHQYIDGINPVYSQLNIGGYSPTTEMIGSYLNVAQYGDNGDRTGTIYGVTGSEISGIVAGIQGKDVQPDSLHGIKNSFLKRTGYFEPPTNLGELTNVDNSFIWGYQNYVANTPATITDGIFRFNGIGKQKTTSLTNADDGSAWFVVNSLGVEGSNQDTVIYVDENGFVPPSLNVVERDAIISPLNGSMIYNKEDSCYQINDGNQWNDLIDTRFRLFDRTQWSNTITTTTVPNGGSLNILSFLTDANKITNGTDSGNGELNITIGANNYIQANWQGVPELITIRVNFHIDDGGEHIFALELKRQSDNSLISSVPVPHDANNYDPKSVTFTTYIGSATDAFVTGGFYIDLINETGSGADLTTDMNILINRAYRSPIK